MDMLNYLYNRIKELEDSKAKLVEKNIELQQKNSLLESFRMDLYEKKKISDIKKSMKFWENEFKKLDGEQHGTQNKV